MANWLLLAGVFYYFLLFSLSFSFFLLSRSFAKTSRRGEEDITRTKEEAIVK